jgi:surface polysaccharide O-acyltransferase-like enzyme
MVVSCCDWGTPVPQLLSTRQGSKSKLQGILGSFLIKLNIAAAVYRRNSILHEWPILEVTGVAAITAAVSYLVSAT